MVKASHYDIDFWQTHHTENDIDLILQTNNGPLFYWHLDQSRFCRSPKVTEQYFKCLEILRSGEEELNDFYLDEACDWLMKPFEPLISRLAPVTIAPQLSASGMANPISIPISFAVRVHVRRNG